MFLLRLILIGTLSSAVLYAQDVTHHDASMFRCGPALAGVCQGTAPMRVTGIRFVFRAEAPIRSTPLLYRERLYFGSSDGTVYAIDARDGHSLWKIHADGPVSSSPAARGGTIYFVSRPNLLYAVDAATGTTRWRRDLGQDAGPHNYWDFFESSPTLAGERLFVGSGNGRVYAFESASGKQLWSYDSGARVRSTPAVSGNTVVFGAMNGRVYAVDATTGKEKWTYSTRGASNKYSDKNNDTTSVVASPTIAGNAVMVGGRDSYLYAIDLETGKLRWELTQDGSSWMLSTGSQGRDVLIGGGSAFLLQSVAIETGKENWRFKARSAIFSSPAISGDVVVVSDLSGFVHAVRASTGKELWSFPLGDRALSSPVVGDHAVYVASDDGMLVALETSDAAAASGGTRRELVYWQGPHSANSFSWFAKGIGEGVRDSFVRVGFQQIDAAQLQQAIEDQVAHRSDNVIVFADNRMPPALYEASSEGTLIRRFIQAGGGVVFLGLPPVDFVVDAASGEVAAIDDEGLEKALGVPSIALENERGYHVSIPTAEGKQWGLRDAYVSNAGAVLAPNVTTVLARNEFGAATSWYKTAGNGFLLQLQVPQNRLTDLTPVLWTIGHCESMPQ